jgi:predicted RNA-binding protein Jag
VVLSKTSATLISSPILLDGTVSFALYSDFSKANQLRYFRFQLKAGERVELQYLIPDTKAMKKIATKKLPEITLTRPDGTVKIISINQRRSFFEPYSKKSYIYLSEMSEPALAGAYVVTIKSRAASSIVMAVGTREIAGAVLTFGKKSCPLPKQLPNSTVIEVQQTEANQLVGMKEEIAQLCASMNNWLYRVGERDGEEFALTMDYRVERVTVSIKSGVITKVLIG